MNKSIMSIATLLSLALTGCAPAMTRDGGADPETTCGDRAVTVYQSTGFLAVYPEYIDVCAGYRVTITAVPRVADGNVRTQPEEGNPGMDGWLGVEGRPGGAVVIGVPADATAGVYKYGIIVDGVGMLDPRIRVVRR
ncbi:MAG: hypothetical protein WD795_20995 [Woeseia sp.]